MALFTFWMVCVFVVDTFTFLDARSLAVSRMSKGDRFTNPYSDGDRGCAEFQASCSADLLKKCNECKCNSGNETYRPDLKRCVSSEDLFNYSACTHKGITADGNMDAKLVTLDLTKKGTKNINGPFHLAAALKIKCIIGNRSSYLNQTGHWNILKNIDHVLRIDVSKDHTIKLPRYLTLNWEGVDKDYRGLLLKLQIVCESKIGVDSESSCFLFKTKGSHIDKIQVSSNKPKASPKVEISTQNLQQTSTYSKSNEYTTSSSPTPRIAPTKKTDITYSALRNVIIGVSAGVGLVILIIVILAICYVQYRMRKVRETKEAPVARNEVVKVHFTAQTRFSLIRETDQAEAVEPSPDDYTCLQDRRESYDPYCPLQKDDVDLDVIDQILKEAVSMESMEPSSEPRYSCHLSGDDKTVIITAVEPARQPPSPKIPHEYHVLEEPDYEEVDSSSDEESISVATKLLEVKPPLPERQYTLEPPKITTMYSEC